MGGGTLYNQMELNTSPFEWMTDISKNKEENKKTHQYTRNTPLLPRKGCKNDFICIIQTSSKKKTSFKAVSFLLEVKKRAEGRKAIFHVCIKLCCWTKGHGFYTLVLDQMLSLLSNGPLFMGTFLWWCDTAEV